MMFNIFTIAGNKNCDPCTIRSYDHLCMNLEHYPKN
jgi:hypothetical protein